MAVHNLLERRTKRFFDLIFTNTAWATGDADIRLTFSLKILFIDFVLYNLLKTSFVPSCTLSCLKTVHNSLTKTSPHVKDIYTFLDLNRNHILKYPRKPQVTQAGHEHRTTLLRDGRNIRIYKGKTAVKRKIVYEKYHQSCVLSKRLDWLILFQVARFA